MPNKFRVSDVHIMKLTGRNNYRIEFRRQSVEKKRLHTTKSYKLRHHSLLLYKLAKKSNSGYLDLSGSGIAKMYLTFRVRRPIRYIIKDMFASIDVMDVVLTIVLVLLAGMFAVLIAELIARLP